MRRTPLILTIVAAVFLAGCPKNNQEVDAGRKAEQLQDYDTALVHYERALRDQPGNTEYKLLTMHTRMEDAQYHVDQGQKALQKGDLQQALAEFQRAQNVDPSNTAADQGIQKAMQAIAAKNAPQPSASDKDEQTNDADLLIAPPGLKPLSRDPINLKMTNDTRVIYETIGKLAGLSVVFDPDVTPRRVSIELPGVTLEQALDIVSLQTRSFWKPLTGTVIFVAPDNPQKRRDVEDEEVQTFYLSNTITAQDLTEIVTGLRQLLDLRRIQQVNAQNAIIIRARPDELALASKIIHDADKAKPEVLIHVQVLTANRDRMRDLGILPGQSASLIFNPTCAVQPSSANCTSTSSSSTTTSSTTSVPTIALNELKNLSTADYSLTLPGATANAILTDNRTKIIQDPEVRIADGEKATLKIGEKVPIATGSFQAGVGVSTTSVSPLVNTQFTYQDVGVNITVTPRVHPGGDVSMKLTVEISALDGSESIGGITQPIISSQSIDHDVRLKDGEVSVLGGLIQRTETKNLNGIPGISQIPGLRDIIGDNNTDVQENELLIVLTPHIIRFPSIDRANLETIAAGTDTNARVYHDGENPMPTAVASPANPASPVASAAVPGQAPAIMTAAALPPGAVVSAAPPAPGGTAQLRFDPGNVTMKVGDTQTIGLSVANVNDLYSLPLMIHYNPALLKITEIRDGGFLSGGSQAIAIVQRIDDQNGQAVVSATRQPNTPGVNGSGTLLGIVVRAIAPGNAALQVLQVNAHDSQQRPIPLVSGEATIQVH